MSDKVESIFGRSPPPVAGDVLFGGNKEYWSANACISHWGEDGHSYKSGFRKAALQLATHVCATSSDQDLLIYPIVYLYRHHIEMVLKDIFRDASFLLGGNIPDDDEKKLITHDLQAIWNLVLPLLNPVSIMIEGQELPTEDLEGITSYIQQIHRHDPDGQRFRYARIRQKKPNAPKGTYVNRRSLEPELTLINVGDFAIHLEKLADYLDGLQGWVAACAQWQREEEANAR